MKSLGRILANESGFTLIELLGVALILIILAVMSLPVYAKVTDDAREGKSAENLRVVEQALEAYHASPEHNHYPGSLQALIDEGFLKPSADSGHSPFESPWSGKKNRIYLYYAVDRADPNHPDMDVAGGFILGDPGPDATCGGPSPVMPCGLEPSRAWVTPDVTTTPPGLDAKRVRKSR